MRSFWYQNASSPSGNGFTKPPDHKTAFYSMRTGHFLALQALVFALVTAAFTNIYITQPAIVIFVSIMLLLPFISGIFETQKENSMEKKSLSKSSKTEIKEMNIVAKRVAFLYE